MIPMIKPGGPHGWPSRLDDEAMRQITSIFQYTGDAVSGHRAVNLWLDNSPEFGVATYIEMHEYRIDNDFAAFRMADNFEPISVHGKVHAVWVLSGWKQAKAPYAAQAHHLYALIPDAGRILASPCGCKTWRKVPVWSAIQHLNDYHHPDYRMAGTAVKGESRSIWTRERIADWLETLDLDLSIDPERAGRVRYMRGAQQGSGYLAGIKQAIDSVSAATGVSAEDIEKMAEKFGYKALFKEEA